MLGQRKDSVLGSLVERYDPHIRSRTAGQLLSYACEARGIRARSGVLRTSFRGEDVRWLACGDCSEPSGRHRACDALVVEFRAISDVGTLSTRTCGCLACKSSRVRSLPAMEIDALQQHNDKKCHTCGRFGHLAKDCWQNKGKSKGKDPKGKGGNKGKVKGKGKTDKDVCLKCGQRAHWAKNCPNPAKAIHGLALQNDANNSWWQWYDGQEWKAPSEQSTAESQYVAPTQPMAEPEAAMGGLWLASVMAGE